MGKTTGSAGAQDERICRPAHESGEPRYVIRVSGANVTNKVDRHVLAPVRGGLQSAAAAVVKQYKISRSAERLNLTGKPRWRCEGRERWCNEKDAICLTETEVRPLLICGFGAVERYVIPGFCSMEPTSWVICRHAIEEDRSLAVAGKLFMKIVGNSTVIDV